MAASGYITRTSLSLANLAIVNTTYDVYLDDATALDIGSATWRRTVAESPFVDGRIVVAAVKDTPVMNLRVDVVGSSLSDVQTKVQTLVTAVWQTTYQLSLTLDSGATYTWNCEPADVTLGVNFQHVFGLAAPVLLQIPRKPTPVAGPI